VLAAYVDESGIHQGSPAIIVAAYVSTVDQWGRFDREWSDLLRQEGLSCFHMTDYENRRREFTDWDQARRIRVMGQVTAIIHRRTQLRVGVGVNRIDLETHLPFDDGTSAYTYCAMELVKQVGTLMRRYHPKDRVSYIFESGTGFGGQVTDFMNVMRSAPHIRDHHRLGSHSFGDKRELTPLQAADVLAYECWKEVINRVIPNSSERRARRVSLRHLLRYKTTFHWIDKVGLARLARELNESGETGAQ